MVTIKRKLAQWFIPSDLPTKTRLFIQNEGLLFSVERVRITVVYHRFKAPGRNIRHKQEILQGSLAISNKRLVGYAFRKRVIHISFESAEADKLKFSCVNGKVLVIVFDPALFNPQHSGSMEIRYHFADADQAYRIIRNHIRLDHTDIAD